MTQIEVSAASALTQAIALMAEGQKVRLSAVWNGSWHNPSYRLVLRYGSAIRKPQTIEQVRDTLARNEAMLTRVYGLSRKGD